MKIINKLSYILLIASLVCCTRKNSNNTVVQKENEKIIVGGGCDGCELMYQGMPEKLSNIDTSKGWNERGQKLIIEGTVFKSDGKTVASDVILYYWQTGSDGLYSKKGNETTIHGYLRGWLKTNRNGNFKIFTIRPSSYPNEEIPAHIHFSIKEPLFKMNIISMIFSLMKINI
jgi:protocatechuate 3,4-dioxygenase beta subunit